MKKPYRYALSITSQFPFCSIPFRLDSFSACQFACHYCFAAARGGYLGDERLSIGDPHTLDRRLRYLESNEPRSVLDELLRARIPLHFGGMSDPFMPLEESRRVTLEFLRVLQRHHYPCIVSTKSDLCASEPYLEVLSTGNFAVQFSISTDDDDLALRTDAGVPTPSRRFKAMRELSRLGVRTSCRIQPVLPGRESDAFRIVKLSSESGASHVSVEHLKWPVETGVTRSEKLAALLGLDLSQHLKNSGATRCGREWILPVSGRLPLILELRQYTRQLGLTFGAADNDLLHLSDGESCCSGADLMGFDTVYRFTYTQAIHASIDGSVRFESLKAEWRPKKSVGQFVNSNSRIPGSSVEAYLRDAWNGRMNGCSPANYYGLSATGEHDDEGLVVYAVDPKVWRLIQEGRVSGRRVGNAQCQPMSASGVLPGN